MAPVGFSTYYGGVKWQVPAGETPDLTTGERVCETAACKKSVAEHQQSSRRRDRCQILNSLIPDTVFSYLIYHSLAVLGQIALPPAILAGGFLVRWFSIHHYGPYA